MRKLLFEKTTVFAGNEGYSEEVFMRHLRSLYAQGKTAVTLKVAGGKNPKDIVEKSYRQRNCGSYNHSLILLDTDKSLDEAGQLANLYRFELFKSSPCLEGLLLNILGKKVPATSNECKALFQSTYNGGADLLAEKTCKDHFSLDVIEKARKRISDPLDRLIKRLQGDFS